MDRIKMLAINGQLNKQMRGINKLDITSQVNINTNIYFILVRNLIL